MNYSMIFHALFIRLQGVALSLLRPSFQPLIFFILPAFADLQALFDVSLPLRSLAIVSFAKPQNQLYLYLIWLEFIEFEV